MKLKSFGCSFVWGSEMADAEPYPSQRSWPALLAQHLNLPYQCMARPGGGNLLIAEQVLNHVALPGAGDRLMSPAVFVINWTFIDRFDYTTAVEARWDTIRPGGSWDGQESLAEHYYRNLHSQYRDKLTTLMHIKLCIDSLQQAGHEFIMTYMDELILETKWHTSPAVLRLQEYIRPHLRQFDGRNMLDYSRDRGHDFGHQAHPLESAHADLFQYALANFGIDKIKTA
jgi:hypothetical protein